jgi:hypothetical protein
VRPCGCLWGLIPAPLEPRSMPAACSVTVPERCDGFATGTRFHHLGLALGLEFAGASEASSSEVYMDY